MRKIKDGGKAGKVTIPKVFKAEGRGYLKAKNGLIGGKIYELPKGMILEKDRAGCVGKVLPGTIIKLSTIRTTPVGKLYFFDGFKFDEFKNLVWIGEFDVLAVDLVAQACGKEVTAEQYKKLVIPEAPKAEVA